MIVPVTLSLFFSIILLSPFFTYAVILEPQVGGLEISSNLLKKIQKLIDISSACVELATTTGGFSDSCIRFHVAVNLGLTEIFNDNQTKSDIDKILYG
ncbi:MAG: hypothetical protein CV087_23715 [Candidatus Brocadia sp. WS118]|nr:MAG: hypothetical protein CV087_23715 [Candidatus Brocadia sp. WS118]